MSLHSCCSLEISLKVSFPKNSISIQGTSGLGDDNQSGRWLTTGKYSRSVHLIKGKRKEQKQEVTLVYNCLLKLNNYTQSLEIFGLFIKPSRLLQFHWHTLGVQEVDLPPSSFKELACCEADCNISIQTECCVLCVVPQ